MSAPRMALKSAAGSAREFLLLVIAALALLAVMTASPASAHRNEVHEMNQQAEQVTGERLTIGSEQPMGGMMEGMDRDRSQMSYLERLLDWLGRTHPSIIHFPIAFFPAALFTAIVGRRRPTFNKPVQFLVVTGGLTAPIAALFGWFNGGWSLTDTEAVMTLHRWLGTAIGVVGLSLGIWTWVRPEADRSIGMIIGLSVITLAIVVQGWLGGALVHGIDHLNW